MNLENNIPKQINKTQGSKENQYAQQLANEWTGNAAPVWGDANRTLENITNKAEVAGLEPGATEAEISAAVAASVVDGGKDETQATSELGLFGKGTKVVSWSEECEV